MEEMLSGYVKAYGNIFEKLSGRNGLIYKNRGRDRVSVICAGGSGGEPWCLGMCGEGLADAVAVGNIFAAAPATTVSELCGKVCNGKGILLIAGNHTGDRLNSELGRELFLLDNPHGKCEIVYICDDAASSGLRGERRSLIGAAAVVIIAAAAAKSRKSLEEVKKVAEKVNKNLSSISATLECVEHPVTGLKMREIEDGEVHFGMGVTSEPGIEVERFRGERAVTRKLLDYLIEDLKLKKGDEAALMINGFGGVSVLENLIVCNSALDYLAEKGIVVCDTNVNDVLKIQPAKSVAVSLLKLDGELKKYYFQSACSPLLFKKRF